MCVWFKWLLLKYTLDSTILPKSFIKERPEGAKRLAAMVDLASSEYRLTFLHDP